MHVNLYGKELFGEYYPSGWRFSIESAASLDERRYGATFAMNSRTPSEEESPSVFHTSLVGFSFFSLLSRHIYFMLSEV